MAPPWTREKSPARVLYSDRGASAFQAWGQELRALNTKTRPHTIYSIKSRDEQWRSPIRPNEKGGPR